jgi:thiol-disulfide isomerase/thioredoxin/ribosomal protein L12E/L44/L45/RPP1/RPP2
MRLSSFLFWTTIVLINLAIWIGTTPAVEPDHRPPATDHFILLDFTAPWCQCCRAMEPTMAVLAREGYKVVTVNVDEQAALAQRHGVTLLPTVVVFDGGREVDRCVGIVSSERLHRKLSTLRSPLSTPRHTMRPVKPTGYYRSVVRIECKLGKAECLGSGVYVRWHGHPVVLTAWHVVKDLVLQAGRDAKIIVWTHDARRYTARCLTADSVWDCAVLEVVSGQSSVVSRNEQRTTDNGQRTDILPIPPADVESGGEFAFKTGVKLEACGYGSDGRLSASMGQFLRFERPEAQGQTRVDDWAVFSGTNREGDSGGPVFDAKGRVVAIMWGTGGQTIVAVQLGRLHLALDAVWRDVYHRTAYEQPTPADAETVETREQPHPVLKWRAEQEQEEARLTAQIAALRQQIAALSDSLRQAQQNPPPAAGPSAGELALQQQLAQAQQQLAQLQAEKEKANSRELTAPGPGVVDSRLSGVDKKLDDFLHKLPIQGPLTKLQEKQLESGHPLEKFFGASAAIVLITVVGCLVIIGIGLVLHAIYVKCHADKTAIAAQLSAAPGVGPALATGFNTLDTFNTGIDAKIQGAVNDLKSHLTALATPAPGQSAPTVVVNPAPSGAVPTGSTSGTAQGAPA